MGKAGQPGPLIIGVGNQLRGDDGAGIELARRLRDRAGRLGIDVLEVVADTTELLEAWSGRDCVVIVDSARSGATPGTIRRLDASHAPLPADLRQASSTHALGLAETLELARALGRLPERVIVFAVEGRRFEHGASLSSEVEAAIAEATSDVLAEARRSRGDSRRQADDG